MARKKIITASSPIVQKDPHTGGYIIPVTLRHDGDLIIELDGPCYAHGIYLNENCDLTVTCPLTVRNEIYARYISLHEDTICDHLFFTMGVNARKSLIVNAQMLPLVRNIARTQVTVAGDLTCGIFDGHNCRVRVNGNINCTESITVTQLICGGNLTAKRGIICSNCIVAHKGTVTAQRIFAGIMCPTKDREPIHNEIFCKSLSGEVACGKVSHEMPNPRYFLFPEEVNDYVYGNGAPEDSGEIYGCN